MTLELLLEVVVDLAEVVVVAAPCFEVLAVEVDVVDVVDLPAALVVVDEDEADDDDDDEDDKKVDEVLVEELPLEDVVVLEEEEDEEDEELELELVLVEVIVPAPVTVIDEGLP